MNTLIKSNYPQFLSGFKKTRKMSVMWTSVSIFIIKKYKNPLSVIKIIKQINALKNKYTVKNTYQKLAYIDGRIFFNLNNTGWPGKHFNRLIDIEARQAVYNDVSNLENLRLVLIAFTKKCPLNCVHCYEGDVLNNKDTLTLEDHKAILKKIQSVGISTIHFGGGEPMAKFNDLVELLESAEKTADFWIYTSGFNLTEPNAIKLKKAGLTGVAISLDHYLPEKHNKFRRHKDAFEWTQLASQSALNSKLVITLSLCTTKDFCNPEDLYNYLELAKKMGASFVQLLEPRAAGNFKDQDVLLNQEEIQIIETFFLETNSDIKYKDYPIVLFPGYHQRKTGCPGAGSKYIYIDTDGFISNCPFCQNKMNHILDDDHEKTLALLKDEGCGKFENLN